MAGLADRHKRTSEHEALPPRPAKRRRNSGAVQTQKSRFRSGVRFCGRAAKPGAAMEQHARILRLRWPQGQPSRFHARGAAIISPSQQTLAAWAWLAILRPTFTVAQTMVCGDRQICSRLKPLLQKPRWRHRRLQLPTIPCRSGFSREWRRGQRWPHGHGLEMRRPTAAVVWAVVCSDG